MNKLLKKRRLNPWICSFGALLLSAAAIAFFYLNTLESHLRSIAAGNLAAVNQSCVLAVETWRDDVKMRARYLARDEQIVALATRLVAETRPAASILPIAADPNLNAILAERDVETDVADLAGVRIVDRSGNILSSSASATPVAWNPHDHYEVFQLSHAVVAQPQTSATDDGASHGELLLRAAAPIVSPSGEVIAALVLDIDPSVRFYKYFASGRFGESGVTYAFDETGAVLTPTRFAPGTDARLLASKSANQQPLRVNAVVALNRTGGSNIDGYVGARGAAVLGAWTWLDEAGYGIITEIDTAEAYHLLTAYRNWMTWGTVLSLVTFIGALVVTYVRYRKQYRSDELNASERLGQYVIERIIGKGGMGTVYLANHQFLKRQTAVKVIQGRDIDAITVARFEREVRAASKLKHPNSVSIYDYGTTDDNVFYYAMEFVDGISLGDLVSRFGPLPDGRIVLIMKQICNALQEAHDAGLIHRDVKPANVILSQQSGMSDFVKLLDFGLVKDPTDADSKLTQESIMAGSPEYISPEAIETPDRIDRRADIYSLGAVGYFLMTGRPVFEGTTAAETAMKRLRQDPIPPSNLCPRDVDSMLEKLILNCLSRNPEHRPPTAEAVKIRLDKCPTARDWTFEDAERWWNAHPQCRLTFREQVTTEMILGENLKTVIVGSPLAEESDGDTSESSSKAS